MGIHDKAGVKRNERPTQIEIIREVIRCSLIPRKAGSSPEIFSMNIYSSANNLYSKVEIDFQPGAWLEDILAKDCRWLTDRTFSATSHGSPNIEQTMTRSATTSRSR